MPRRPRPRKDGTTDAIASAMWMICRDLVAARRASKLTRAELAKKLRTTREAVADVEAGRVRASEAYIRRLLRACGLPADWRP